MIDIEAYMEQFLAALKATYGSRLLYMGLQGSYRRGEATPESDVDIMVVLDELKIEDMSAYKRLLHSIVSDAQSCGFICGRKELANWNPCEICQLVHETKDYFGDLKSLLPSYTNEDIRTYIKISAGNLYHEICHRYIHAGEEENQHGLRGSYKQVFYILQNLYFLKTGDYHLTRNDLLSHLDENDRIVLQMAIDLKKGGDIYFTKAYRLLFDWCQQILQTV